MRTPRDRAASSLLLGPVLVAVVFSYVRLIASADDVPPDDDYRAAAKALRDAHAGAGDGLVLLPPWTLRPLSFLGELDDETGLTLVSGDAVASQPLHRYRRLFALVEPGGEDVADALARRLGAPTARTAFARASLWVFDVASREGSAGYDLSAHLDDAQVRVEGGAASVVVCDTPTRGGVLCPGRDSWQRLTREWLLVSENGDVAVWSHPPRRGERLIVDWPQVPLGRALVVRAGFTRDADDRAKAPVRLAVLVDDEVVARLERRPHADPSSHAGRWVRSGFASDEIDTARLAGPHRLRFVVDTDDNGAAHFAWDAYVVEAR